MHIDPVWSGHLVCCSRCEDFVIVPLEKGNLATPLRDELRLENDRVRLRLPRRGDRRELLEILSHEPNFRFEISPPSDAKALAKLLRDSSYPRGFRRTRLLRFVIEDLSPARVVGTIAIELSDDFLTGNLGLMIHEPDQCRGIGTAAVYCLVALSFEKLRLRKVSAACDSRNAPCRQLFEKCGFRREGEMLDFYRHPDRGWIDISLFARSRPDCERARS